MRSLLIINMGCVSNNILPSKVKLWEMYMTCGRRRLRLDKSSRQHKSTVHCLVIEENRDLASWDLRFASASLDRSCIVWNLRLVELM